MFLSLRGARINNDGYLDIKDIHIGAQGSNDNSNSLLCHTDASGCCSTSGPSSDWFLPDGTLVMSGTSLQGYQRNRNTGVVRLYRTSNISPSQTTRGRFRCEIEDSTGAQQTLYANICTSKNRYQY